MSSFFGELNKISRSLLPTLWESASYIICINILQCVCVAIILPMMTVSNGSIFGVTRPLCREFDRWIPPTKVNETELWCFSDPRLNKLLSKQSWDWWFEMPSRSLWLHCNAMPGRVIRYLTVIIIKRKFHLNWCRKSTGSDKSAKIISTNKRQTCDPIPTWSGRYFREEVIPWFFQFVHLFHALVFNCMKSISD